LFPSAFQLDKQSSAEAKYLILKNTVEGERKFSKKISGKINNQTHGNAII